MAETTDRAFSTEDVGQAQEPAGAGVPADPAKSTESEIKQALTEPSGTAAGMSYGAEEPSSKEHALEALGSLTSALTVESAKSAEAIGELGVSEVRAALDRGLDPAGVLGAGLSSGVLSAETAEELAWNAALAAQGLSEEELAEIDDGEMSLSEEIAASSEQLLLQAKGLAHQQDVERIYETTYAETFEQGIKNHEESVKALREYQRELGYDGPTMEALLVGVDAELQGGILGQGMADLDQLAITDPRAFAAALRSVGSVILEGFEAEDAHALKSRILGQERDISSGLTIDGQSVREPPQLGLDEAKFVDAVARRSQPGPYERPPALPPERSVRDGFKIGNRRVAMDDIPLEGGGTARSRLKEALRGDKP